MGALSGGAGRSSGARPSEEFEKHWKVEDGELVNDGNGAYADHRQEFGDIELLIDYKTVAKADSGIYLRGNPQVQIWDTTEAGGKWNLGAQRLRRPLEQLARRAGQGSARPGRQAVRRVEQRSASSRSASAPGSS